MNSFQLMKTIAAFEVKALKSRATFIHDLLEEHYEREHLPGALNACVYETAFHSKVAELVPDQAALVIVYCAGGESLACEDLVDTPYNAMLIRHLRDDDFFAVDRFPTAEFVCERAEPLASCTPGTPNYSLHGMMTLRGVTKPLSFPAVIATADADHLTGQAQFELDRTQFGSQYGSGRLFAFLGKHVVNDHIHLHIKLHATRAHKRPFP